jgi:hypothetical protein
MELNQQISGDTGRPIMSIKFGSPPERSSKPCRGHGGAERLEFKYCDARLSPGQAVRRNGADGGT